MIDNLDRPNTAVIFHARNWGITGPGARKGEAIRAHSGSMQVQPRILKKRIFRRHFSSRVNAPETAPVIP